MNYEFQTLGSVELLDSMPENAKVIVEVDGATKRAPQANEITKIVGSEKLAETPEDAAMLAEVNGEIKRVPQVVIPEPIDEIAIIASSETLAEVPEGATALVEVGGEIKRVPGDELGGKGMVVNFSMDMETESITAIDKTYEEVKTALEEGRNVIGVMNASSEEGLSVKASMNVEQRLFSVPGVADADEAIAFYGIAFGSDGPTVISMFPDNTATIDDISYKPSTTSSVTQNSTALVTSGGVYTALQENKFSGNYNDLTNKPTLATVATSGSYNDLNDKPEISGGGVGQSMAGKTVQPTNTGSATAADGAEIFNDTRERTFNTITGLASTGNVASGLYSHAEGSATTASGNQAHAEGLSTVASSVASHAEGSMTTASGPYSHAEGNETAANGNGAHAEGARTKANGSNSHAEGTATIAIASGSHVEGNSTETKYGANCSHAEGYMTIATAQYQHVQGVLNIEDTEKKYAHIVGNGVYDPVNPVRSNAHTIDWDGNGWFAGTVESAAIIIASSTEGSTKKFKITVDDSGTVTATEVV